MGGNPLPVFAGVLAYQVTGWITGKSIFDSANTEAGLFAFLVVSLGFVGWLYWKNDQHSSFPTIAGRLYFWGIIVIGMAFGILFRLTISMS